MSLGLTEVKELKCLDCKDGDLRITVEHGMYKEGDTVYLFDCDLCGFNMGASRPDILSCLSDSGDVDWEGLIKEIRAKGKQMYGYNMECSSSSAIETYTAEKIIRDFAAKTGEPK